jgi:hypothetical protein
MVWVLKQGATKDEIQELQKQIADATSKPLIDLRKYCGVIKLREDPLEIQRKMRDEWE